MRGGLLIGALGCWNWRLFLVCALGSGHWILPEYLTGGVSGCDGRVSSGANQFALSITAHSPIPIRRLSLLQNTKPTRKIVRLRQPARRRLRLLVLLARGQKPGEVKSLVISLLAD